MKSHKGYNRQIKNLATVITNLMSAIPWVGHDIVELKDVVECTLPTIGTISKHAFKNGRKERLDKKEFLSIPYSFLAMIVGFIDGDGYISITKSTKGFITLNITISLHIKDLSGLQYIQTVLGLGRINLYPKSGKQDTCKLVINKTDLQEVLFPLFIYHKLFFLQIHDENNMIKQYIFYKMISNCFLIFLQ